MYDFPEMFKVRMKLKLVDDWAHDKSELVNYVFFFFSFFFFVLADLGFTAESFESFVDFGLFLFLSDDRPLAPSSSENDTLEESFPFSSNIFLQENEIVCIMLQVCFQYICI